MPYATVFQVEAETPARAPFGPSTVPNAAQVGQYTIDASSKADMLLVTNGYDVPVPTTATTAYNVIAKAVAQMAAYEVERNAPTNGGDLSYYQTMAEYACKMLQTSKLPGLDRDRELQNVRWGPRACATPLFSIEMGL